MSDSLLDSIMAEASGFVLVQPSPPSSGSASASASAVTSSATSRVLGVSKDLEGLKGTVSTAKTYSVVSVCASDSSVLCMGVMNNVGSLSFCIRKNCGTKSHTLNKYQLENSFDSFVFIARIPGASVFIEPCVKASEVPEAILAEWRAASTTLPNWVKAFRAVAVSYEEEKYSAPVSGDFKETKFLADAESYRTPFKKQKGLEDRDAQEVGAVYKDVKVVVHERALPPVSDALRLEAFIASGSLGKGGLTRIVSEVETSLNTLGEAVRGVVTQSELKFEANERDLNAMLGILQNLFATIGPTAEIDASLEAPTLWGTTAFIAEDVVRLGGSVEAIQAELKPAMDKVHRVLMSDEATTKNNDKIVQVLAMVMGHVRSAAQEMFKVNDAVKRIDSELIRLKESGGAPPSVGPNQGGDSMDALMSLLKEGARVEGTRAGVANESVPAPVEPEFSPSIRIMLSDIAQLTEDVRMLKSCAEDTAVKFGGLGLKSLQECHSWVLKNFADCRYGLVLDPLLMLERIFGGDITDNNQLKVLESRLKLKIPTGAESVAIAALAYPRPRLFHSGKVAMTTERNTSRLSKLPNYKSWNSGGQGVRNYIIKQMNLIQSTVTNDISYAFGFGVGAGPHSFAAHSLATLSLNATATFLTQLFVFVDSLYEKLHVDSRFSADQSWALTTQILDRICEELYAPKEGVQEAMTIEDPASICSHVLWASMKTHDVMAGYIDLRFENHPTIAAEYVKFLATNSGHDKVDKLEVVVKELKEEMNAATKNSKAAVTKADVATGKSDSVKTALEALIKRVKALEDRR